MSSGRSVTLRSGHAMPLTGYGTWQAAPGEVGDGVYEALKTGYRHLDLAKIYQNQREVGEGIRRALADVPGLERRHLFITSKLWNTKHRPADVEPALDDTLAELQLDYLDLYLIHWPVAFKPGDELFPATAARETVLDRGVSICQTWKAMTQLPASKARSVGVSNFAIEHLDAIIADSGVVPAVNQIERHPRLPGTALVDYCAQKGIAITAYSPFGNNGEGVPLLVHADEVKAVAERLSRAAAAPVTPAQVILAWSRRGGHAVIPKSVTPARIRQNFCDVELDDDAVAAIDRLAEQPRRFNIPYTYDPKWNVNVFGDDEEKGAANQVLLRL